MTRDEAIAASVRCRSGDVSRTANQVKAMHINAGRRIDSYVALGMLKLDEPKSADGMARDALCGIYQHAQVARILNMLAASGLKIVEK